MDLRDVDLNLLVVLDVLLEERKLVSAARRLGIASPRRRRRSNGSAWLNSTR